MQLYIGNLAPETDEGLLYELISLIAPVESVRLPRQKGVATHQGYGFALFATSEDAEYLLKINGEMPIVLNGKPIKVRMATRSGATSNINSVSSSDVRKGSSNHIGNLTPAQPNKATQKTGFGLFIRDVDPLMLTYEDLHTPFTRFGTICDIEIPVDPTGKPKGHAFVRYMDRNAAEAAQKELNGQILLNGKCSIEYERI